jgi:hypothetical protein
MSAVPLSPSSRTKDESELRASLDHYHADTDGPLRLIYVPTHRPCHQVISRVADELSKTNLADELQLLLIDDRDEAQSRSNREAAQYVGRHASFAVNWIGRNEWSEFCELLIRIAELTESQSKIARTALLKESGSYASGMNKASLFAAYLGAASLHRRDSDEFPGFRESDGLTALHVEAVALGDCMPSTPPWQGDSPYFVGSNVLGEPTLDHRDLRAVSPELEHKLDQITSRRGPLGAHDAGERDLHRLAVGDGVDVERDTTGLTEVGVSAMRRVYEWIPEMPAIGILGTDHFQKGLLYKLELPLLWHELSAHHLYDAARAEQRDTVSVQRYILSELRFAVLKQYWNASNDSLIAVVDSLRYGEGAFRSALYADLLRGVLDVHDSQAHFAADSFIEVHQRAFEQANGDVKVRHRARLDAMRQARSEVVGYVRDAVVEYSELVRLWPQLIEGAYHMHRQWGLPKGRNPLS